MTKALLFGANGYLGRHIAHWLEKNEIVFTVVDIQSESIDGRSNYQKADITVKEDLLQLDFDIDYIFFFSGLTGTKLTVEQEQQFNSVNVDGVKNVLSRCEPNRTTFVFPSTRLVYKGLKGRLIKEEDEKETKSYYAKNKLQVEELLRSVNIKSIVFRICVPYGNIFDDNYSYGTIGMMLSMIHHKGKITLYGKGEVKRTFTHVMDIARLVVEGSFSGSLDNQTVNIGGKDALSLFEVASLMISDRNASIEFVSWPPEDLALESGDTMFADDKLQMLYPFEYKYSLAYWLKQ